jgi:hypothetical protein
VSPNPGPYPGHPPVSVRAVLRITEHARGCAALCRRCRPDNPDGDHCGAFCNRHGNANRSGAGPLKVDSWSSRVGLVSPSGVPVDQLDPCRDVSDVSYDKVCYHSLTSNRSRSVEVKAFVLVVALVVALVAVGQVAPGDVAHNSDYIPQFSIGAGFVYVPEGVFLLVRKGNLFAAIRFMNVHPAPPKMATRISAEQTNCEGTADYESYFQADGSGLLQRSNVIKHTGRIDIKPLKGFHPFAFQTGNDKLRVGKWWFGCLCPTLVKMSSHFSDKDLGFEFAPTSAHQVGEIDVLDNRLRWFRQSETENTHINIPVTDLPKPR